MAYVEREADGGKVPCVLFVHYPAWIYPLCLHWDRKSQTLRKPLMMLGHRAEDLNFSCTMTFFSYVPFLGNLVKMMDPFSECFVLMHKIKYAWLQSIQDAVGALLRSAWDPFTTSVCLALRFCVLCFLTKTSELFQRTALPTDSQGCLTVYIFWTPLASDCLFSEFAIPAPLPVLRTYPDSDVHSGAPGWIRWRLRQCLRPELCMSLFLPCPASHSLASFSQGHSFIKRWHMNPHIRVFCLDIWPKIKKKLKIQLSKFLLKIWHGVCLLIITMNNRVQCKA